MQHDATRGVRLYRAFRWLGCHRRLDASDRSQGRQTNRHDVTTPVLLIVLVLSSVVLTYGVGRWLRGKWLVRRFRERFGRKGKYAILVYSESPNWQNYFEEHVVAPTGERAVVLNWSERRLWKKSPSLPIRVFLHLMPARDLNPYALVFLPEGRPRGAHCAPRRNL